MCNRESGRWRCDVTSQAIYDVIALLVTVTWTAVGTHFIADLYLRKNYNTKKPNQDVSLNVLVCQAQATFFIVNIVFTFSQCHFAVLILIFQTCDFDVYWFSFAVILIGWVAVCLAVVYIINKHGRELLSCVTCNKYAY